MLALYCFQSTLNPIVIDIINRKYGHINLISGVREYSWSFCSEYTQHNYIFILYFIYLLYILFYFYILYIYFRAVLVMVWLKNFKLVVWFIMRTRVSNLNFFAQIDQQFRRKKMNFNDSSLLFGFALFRDISLNLLKFYLTQ